MINPVKIFISIIIIVSITALLFTVAGCSQETAPTLTEGSIDLIVPDELETITICFVGVSYNESGEPYNYGGIKRMLADLNDKAVQEINTKVEFKWLPNGQETQYITALKKSLGSENAPDAFCLYEGIIESLYREGFLKDLTELLPDRLPEYYLRLQQASDFELDHSCRFDGRIYAIPNNDIYSSRYCVIAREDLVEKYSPGGIADIGEYDDFLWAVKEHEDGISPGLFFADDYIKAYMTESGYYNTDTPIIYGRWDNQDINPEIAYDIGVFQSACASYNDYKTKEYLYDWRSTYYFDDTRKGTIASFLSPMLGLRQYLSDITSSFKYKIYPLGMDVLHFRSLHTAYLGINNNSADAERVLLFMQWLQSSQENYDLLMYGVKDIHYKLSGNSLDFSILDRRRNDIINWQGSEVFKNYLFSRPCFYEPENYKEFVEECALKNTVTLQAMLEEKGYDTDRYYDQEAMKAFDRVNIAGLHEAYRNYMQMLEEDAHVGKTFRQLIEEKGLQDEVESFRAEYKLFFENLKK